MASPRIFAEDSLSKVFVILIPPAVDPTQTSDLIAEIKAASPVDDDADRLVELLIHCVPPGVDEAAYVNASYLSAVALGEVEATLVPQIRCVELRGSMQGEYNMGTLVTLLSGTDPELQDGAAEQLKHMLLMFGVFYDVVDVMNKVDGTPESKEDARGALQSWADAEWYTSKPDVPVKITTPVYTLVRVGLP